MRAHHNLEPIIPPDAMLQVEILAEGDHVNELMVVVSGLVEVAKPSEWLGKTSEEESIGLDINSKSIHGGGHGAIEFGTRCATVVPSAAASKRQSS